MRNARVAVIVVLVACAVSPAAAAPSGAVAGHAARACQGFERSSTQPMHTTAHYGIEATHLSCRRARRIARAWVKRGFPQRPPRGWRCAAITDENWDVARLCGRGLANLYVTAGFEGP